jgi:hypothetical protein
VAAHGLCWRAVPETIEAVVTMIIGWLCVYVYGYHTTLILGGGRSADSRR